MIASEFFVAKICEVWYNTRNQTELQMRIDKEIIYGIGKINVSFRLKG